MMKKLFKILTLFALASVATYAVLLFVFPQNTQVFSMSFYLRQPRLTQAQTDASDASDAAETVTQAAATTGPKAPLGPCPEQSPRLLGPLRVEFGEVRTWDQVADATTGTLEIGGRYKPPECIARQKVAIIIPFRNRHEHLKHWLYYLHPILKRQQLDYGVYIINQAGEGTFNRAKLLNVGYVEALKEYDWDCFVFSDVDLVPTDDRNIYKCFDNPRHLAVAMDKFGYSLPYSTYFGGVASLSKEQFLKINGFPNTYWGWGGEDDDIYRRVCHRGMTISRPDVIQGRYKMVVHDRDLHNEPNPVNPGKIEQTTWTMDKDGINTLKYTVLEIRKTPMFTMITVNINAPVH